MKIINKLSVFQKSGYARFEIIKKIKWHLNSIKCSWQRITKGYCDRDLWDMDSYLLSLLSSMLKQLDEQRNCYPSFLDDNEWSEILQTIATKLEHADVQDEDEYFSTDLKNDMDYMTYVKCHSEECIKNLHEGFQLLEKYFYDLWW